MVIETSKGKCPCKQSGSCLTLYDVVILKVLQPHLFFLLAQVQGREHKSHVLTGDDSRKACGTGDLVTCNLGKCNLPQYCLLQYVIILFIVNLSIMSPSLECIFFQAWILVCLCYSCTLPKVGLLQLLLSWILNKCPNARINWCFNSIFFTKPKHTVFVQCLSPWPTQFLQDAVITTQQQ